MQIFFHLGVLTITLLSVASLVYELSIAKTKYKYTAKSLTIVAIIILAFLTYITNQRAERVNASLIELEEERQTELLGGENLPKIEFLALTKQKTRFNTYPPFYDQDTIEFFVEIDIKLLNESKQYYLKNIEVRMTYPNDYHYLELRKTRNKEFTYNQFQDYYDTEKHKTVELGVLPPNVRKHIHRFKLPTVDKQYPITIDVVWENGYYRGNFILTKADTASMQVPSTGLKTDFVLKLIEPVKYSMTYEREGTPKYSFKSGTTTD